MICMYLNIYLYIYIYIFEFDIYTYLKQFWWGSPKIEAASLCKHACRAKLADGATVLVDLPLFLSPAVISQF